MTKAEKKAVLDEFIEWLYARIGTGNGIGFLIVDKLRKEAKVFSDSEDDKA